MTERPILMTPENGQKCFEGSKTQTRRILKDQPGEFVHIEFDPKKGWQYWWDVGSSGMPDVRQEYAPLKCPYGVVGDRLYLREACWIWGAWISGFDEEKKRRVYSFVEADSKRVTFQKPDSHIVTKKQANTVGWVRRPGIFMPRWACRTVVEITEIRVQRVQEISEEDAKAEGLVKSVHDHGTYWGIQHADVWETDPRKTFKRLWNSINSPDSWDANPFVWAITFKKVPA